MIEQYLQVAIEFLKEVWFQLDSMLGLEETKAFQFIKPYLLQLQDSPTYMGVALIALALIPFGLYKIKNNARERDRKLEELMEEMDNEEEEYEEEEYDGDDPRNLRRPEPSGEETAVIPEDEMEEEGDKDLLPFTQILEKLNEEDKKDELHVNTQKVMGTEEEKIELEPVSSELAEPDINKDLSEFEEFDFDSEYSDKEDSIEAETSHDQAIKELQKEGGLIELEGELSEDDPSSNNSELGDIIIVDETTIEDNPIPEPELEVVAEEPVTDKIESEPLQPVPERDYSLDSRSGREAESLINRLKYLQENLDTRSDHVDKKDSFSGSEPTSKDLVVDPHFVEQQSFVSKSPRISPEDNKKYMEVLESFIFLKNQNKH